MTKFVILYRGPKGMGDTTEDQQRLASALGAWYQLLGAAIVDGGHPFGVSSTYHRRPHDTPRRRLGTDWLLDHRGPRPRRDESPRPAVPRTQHRHRSSRGVHRADVLNQRRFVPNPISLSSTDRTTAREPA
jgi:hypothetical protein